MNRSLADDLALVAETRRELQSVANVLDSACTRWGMTISGEKTTQCAVTHHPEGSSLRRGQVFLISGKHGWTRWQGERKNGSEAGKGRDCIPDVEKVSFQKPQSKQRNQTMYMSSEPW